jgi:hypothetical protein
MGYYWRVSKETEASAAHSGQAENKIDARKNKLTVEGTVESADVAR